MVWRHKTMSEMVSFLASLSQCFDSYFPPPCDFHTEAVGLVICNAFPEHLVIDRWNFQLF